MRGTSLIGTKSVMSRYTNRTSNKTSLEIFKRKNEGFPPFVRDKFADKLSRFEDNWLDSLSLCKPFYIDKEELGFFEKVEFAFKYTNLESKSGVQNLKAHGFEEMLEDISIPHGLLFPLYKFDLKQFIQEERKFVLIIKEVQLINLLGSIINGLSLCRSLKLPHGNLSLTTIFKKGKYDWEISPPLYSRINLVLRRTSSNPHVKVASSGEYAVDYLIPQEIYKILDEIKRSGSRAANRKGKRKSK